MKILIVEDEVLVALAMDDSLSDVGHEVVGLARDEALAIKIAEATRPDLALVDLNLARHGSGARVVRALRERYRIPSIFVSANPDDCEKIGFHVRALGCLAKPFTPSQLITALDAAAAILSERNPVRMPQNLNLYYLS